MNKILQTYTFAIEFNKKLSLFFLYLTFKIHNSFYSSIRLFETTSTRYDATSVRLEATFI